MCERKTINDSYEKLSQVLLRVSHLEGVTTAHRDDDVVIRGGHYDDYLLVGYLGQLLERGEMEIKVMPSRIPFLFKLLHMDCVTENKELENDKN